MSLPSHVSILCLSALSDELADVLSDTRCSYMDSSGRFHLARPEVLDGVRTDVGSYCQRVLAQLRRGDASATIDLGAGRVPVAAGVLANPVDLLHWLIGQANAVDFHPTVNAYIFSSDPDDILPFLPFHPAPGRGGRGVADVRAVRAPIARAVNWAHRAGSVVVASYELSLPSGTG